MFITAFGLDEGESLHSLAKQGPPAPGAAAIDQDEHGFLWINREEFHKSFAADVTNDEAAVMAAVQRPLSVASFAEAEVVRAVVPLTPLGPSNEWKRVLCPRRRCRHGKHDGNGHDENRFTRRH